VIILCGDNLARRVRK